eukprot:jgi/Hompol1/2985/HPOL_003084-RA
MNLILIWLAHLAGIAAAQNCTLAPSIAVLAIAAPQPSLNVTTSLHLQAKSGCNAAGSGSGSGSGSASNSSISCYASSSDPANVIVATDASAVTIVANAPLGTRTITVSCVENGAVARVGTSVSVVQPTDVTISSGVGTVQSIPDGVPFQVTLSVLSATAPGGFLDSFVCFHVSKTSGTWSNVSSNPSCDFTKADIANNQVFFTPATQPRISTQTTIAIPFTVDNTLGNSASGQLNFIVVSTPYMMLTANQAVIVSNKSSPIIITPSQIGVYEIHALSAWEAIWTLPSISGLGVWEWFCPDYRCGGPAWVQFQSFPATISQAWIAMGALRWNPSNLAAASGITTLSVSFIGTNLTQTLNLTIADNYVPPSPSASPQSISTVNAGGCSDPIMLLRDGTSAGPTVPFGPFISASPLRPLCATVFAYAWTPIQVGDLVVTPTCTSLVSVSGSISIHPAAILPPGFSPITFTGTSSPVGTMLSALQITMSDSCQFTIQTPQVRVTSNNSPFFALDKSSFTAVSFDVTNGNTYYIGTSNWNDDPLNPLRLIATLPGAGTYIFGTLNIKAATGVKVSMGTKTQYFGAWASQVFIVDSFLNVTIASPNDATLTVSPVTLPSKLSVTIVASYVISVSDASAIVTLKSPKNTGYVWA